MTFQDLFKEFTAPSADFRGKPFWAWNSRLEGPELRRQVRILSEMGFGGFFMHSRVGLDTPYLGEEWFKAVQQCLDEAERTKTEVWLYDEDRFPSGSCGGRVTMEEQHRQRSLCLSEYAAEGFYWPADGYVFGALFENKDIRWYIKMEGKEDIADLPEQARILVFQVQSQPTSSWYNYGAYLDTMNEEAVRRFIETTHEVYRQKVGMHFGRRIPGIFTDEPNLFDLDDPRKSTARIPWTGKLPEKFKALFGYEILDYLPELFFDLIPTRPSRARYHYHRCRTRLFAEAFARQIGEWCEKHHLHHTGHILFEEPMTSQVRCAGSAMQFYAYMQIPGVDILTQYSTEYATVKQCVSVARQTGRKWVLSELYGCTGWETTFETYKHSGDWQTALGITLRCPHLAWYSMAGEAKRDHPASIHFHSPWWKQYRAVEDYFSRLNVVLTAGEPVCDLAVIHPLESFYLHAFVGWETADPAGQMDKEYTQLVSWLLSEHLDFDFADEHLLVEWQAQVTVDQEGPLLQIGRMKYRAILVPPMTTLRATTLELLKKFAEAGGTVIFSGEPAALVDAEISDAVKTFAAGKTVAFTASAISTALANRVRRVSICDPTGREIPDVFYQLRRIGTEWALFLVNTNRKTGYDHLTVRLRIDRPAEGQIQEWDPLTGQQYQVPGTVGENRAEFPLSLSPSGSRLFFLVQEAADLPVRAILSPHHQEIQLDPAGWDFRLEDSNVLVLDRVDGLARCEERPDFFEAQKEIIHFDHDLREHLGLTVRGWNMPQPWLGHQEPLGPTAHLQLTCRFEVQTLPSGPVQLAMEQPQRWTVKLNNQPINSGTDTGWWVDPAIRTLSLPNSLFQIGVNTLTLEGRFDRRVNLENFYILGSFGVRTDGQKSTIVGLPEKLNLGSWLDQGLPFYAGNVVYQTAFTIDIQPKARYVLKVPRFDAAAIEIILNGGTPILSAWPPYETDITENLRPGRNTLGLRLLGSRRNAFGPLHLAKDNPMWIGPLSFAGDPDNPQQEMFKLVPYGLYEPPTILASSLLVGSSL